MQSQSAPTKPNPPVYPVPQTPLADKPENPELDLVFERDITLPVRDGTLLRANLYRPPGDAPVPVIMTLGPYGKDAPLATKSPANANAIGGSVFLNWETPDPAHWVPRGYAVLRVDSRGSGHSPGYMDPVSRQQAEDYYDAIEWAGAQSWSSGKVGLLGISYYAISQWAVAALKPPHLSAMVPWDGASDMYREFLRHGGISNGEFIEFWSGINLKTAHPGSDGVDTYAQSLRHPLDDETYTGFSPDLAQIDAPLLSVGNWGNLQLHLRGNVEGFTRASSPEKWLRIIEGGHMVPFYRPDALAMQEAFLQRFLKGDAQSWRDEPRVRILIRDARGRHWRDDTDWPLAGTKWLELALDAQTKTLVGTPPGSDATASYPAPNGLVGFALPPVTERTEITGPAALHLWVSSSTTDADLYVRLRQIDAQGEEVFGISPQEQPNQVLAQGWLRASLREPDARRTLPYRPYQSYGEASPLTPDTPVAVDIEIWPTSIVLHPGDELLLEIGSSDPSTGKFRMGVDPADRPAGQFDGTNAVFTGPSHRSYLRLPVVPAPGGD